MNANHFVRLNLSMWQIDFLQKSLQSYIELHHVDDLLCLRDLKEGLPVFLSFTEWQINFLHKSLKSFMILHNVEDVLCLQLLLKHLQKCISE